MFAMVLSVACLVPAPASAYYYHGGYYPYRYRGHYYRYHYNGHYYLHRRWVAGVYGHPPFFGHYRYW
jgi:hypothetical protein